MKKYRSVDMINAYKLGGYRERYAMDNGNKNTVYINGNKCFKFTYSKNHAFQAGNGATYNADQKRWIN